MINIWFYEFWVGFKYEQPSFQEYGVESTCSMHLHKDWLEKRFLFVQAR